MKKLILTISLSIIMAGLVQASEINTLKTQQNPTHKICQAFITDDEITYNAILSFIMGETFWGDGNYAMARACYIDTKQLFECIGDTEKAKIADEAIKKADKAIQKAAEMKNQLKN